MNDDELMSRLQRNDPSSGVPVHPVDGPDAAALLEQIMNEPIMPATPAKNPYAPSRKAWWGFGVAAATLVAIGATVVIVDNSGTNSDTKSVTQVSYSLPASGGGPATSMCMRVDSYLPTPGQPAFLGTVGAIADGKVTVIVDKWYSGGDADEVILNAPDATQPDPVLEGGVAFEVGKQYLVAAFDGQVAGCGVSAEVSPELTALYEQWFPV